MSELLKADFHYHLTAGCNCTQIAIICSPKLSSRLLFGLGMKLGEEICCWPIIVEGCPVEDVIWYVIWSGIDVIWFVVDDIWLVIDVIWLVIVVIWFVCWNMAGFDAALAGWIWVVMGFSGNGDVEDMFDVEDKLDVVGHVEDNSCEFSAVFWDSWLLEFSSADNGTDCYYNCVDYWLYYVKLDYQRTSNEGLQYRLASHDFPIMQRQWYYSERSSQNL